MLPLENTIVLLLDAEFKFAMHLREIEEKGIKFEELEARPEQLIDIIFVIMGIRDIKDQDFLVDEFAKVIGRVEKGDLDNALKNYKEFYKMLTLYSPLFKPNLQ